MSMTFEQPVNPKAQELIDQLFGKPVASDGKTLLFDNMGGIRSDHMKQITNAANQPATIEIHSKDDIKTMADGTQYQVTTKGWRKLAGN